MAKQTENQAGLSFAEKLKEALKIVSDEWIEAESQYDDMLKISNELDSVAKVNMNKIRQMGIQVTLEKIQVQGQLAELERQGVEDPGDDETIGTENAANTENGGE